jgi:hypothetical protein
MSQGSQAIYAGRCPQNDMTSTPPVSTVRSTAWDVLFAPETNTTVSTAPSAYIDGYSINKHRPPNAAY